jgi:type I restriction-modification system DNA methylase subunit
MNFDPFIAYCKKHIKGDEKGEAQIFLDRFFSALGYSEGLRDAGANLEYRVKNTNKRTTSFADLVWKPRVLIEMKKSGEDLAIHYQQAFSYWLQLVPNRPKYVILCNFNEFWIYDFDKDIYEPQEKIELNELETRKEAFTFLLPKEKPPLFKTDREDVTEKVAIFIAELYKSLISKNRDIVIEKKEAMHYCLQCVLCLYAEDVNLLPGKIFTRIINECIENPGSGYDKVPESYDLISGLFDQMNKEGITPAGRYQGVDYFNGGLFNTIYPIELTKREIELLEVACSKNWRHINPAIFGTIFEQGMEKEERHVKGAHYTHETDIKKIIDPVIVQPWQNRINSIMGDFESKNKKATLTKLFQLHRSLLEYKILDPACGSGNFLFIAYKEMKLLEREILKYINLLSTSEEELKQITIHKKENGLVNTDQFYGIDLNPFAIELARVTLMIAKELSIKESEDNIDTLPLDNLDNNIICADALFTEWPEVDAIIGNPPFQSKNKMQHEFGAEYVQKLRNAYPEVPGRADFCVYWFFKAHNHLKENSYAGLVGTNTISQNYSREGSLDYIVKHGGTIINGYTSYPWSGAAVVFVSLVSWKKGIFEDKKTLFVEDSHNQLQRFSLDNINSSLSLEIDLTSAFKLHANETPKKAFQGQTHGCEGFLISKEVGLKWLKANPDNQKVLKPYLIGDELVGDLKSQPSRFVIDFTFLNQIEASRFIEPYEYLRKNVLPFIEKKADEEKKGITKSNGRAQWLNTWWLMWRRREDLLDELNTINRYISGSRVSTRIFYDFVSSKIHPNDALINFTLDDDYSFGIIHSKFHTEWLKAKCSTLKGDYRYTTESVWETFPWPQNPDLKQVLQVSEAAKEFRNSRKEVMTDHVMSFRDLYRLLEQPGKNKVKDLQNRLDEAVFDAYNFDKKGDILFQLLQLNKSIAEKEKINETVLKPGLPHWIGNKSQYITQDCIEFLG